MAIPKYEDFLFPFLTQLKDKDVSSKKMKDSLMQHFSLTKEDYLLRAKGGSAFQVDNMIGWVRQKLRKALSKYMIKYNVGGSSKKVYAIKKTDTDFFEE